MAAANSFNVSKAPGALSIKLSTAVFTKAVVANCVVLVPAVAVGATGAPVNVGPAKGAFKSKAVCNPVVLAIVKSPFVIVACLLLICVCIALVTPFKYPYSVFPTFPLSPIKFAFNRADDVIDACLLANAVVIVV